MKILSYIRSHKVLVASILLVVVLGSSSALAYSIMNKKPVASVSEVKTSDENSLDKQPDTKKLDEIAKDSVPANTIAPVEQTPEPAPVATIKSTQEYGEIYLNLSTPQNQKCFDAIVSKWPARFIEAVRESNVKALRVWIDPCATGIFTSPNRSLIEKYGANGEFFDSPAAEAGRNK